MEASSIEWEKYNVFQRAIFWCVLNINIVLPILFLIVTIITIINCKAANMLLEEEKKANNQNHSKPNKMRKVHGKIESIVSLTNTIHEQL